MEKKQRITKQKHDFMLDYSRSKHIEAKQHVEHCEQINPKHNNKDVLSALKQVWCCLVVFSIVNKLNKKNMF